VIYIFIKVMLNNFYIQKYKMILKELKVLLLKKIF